MLFSTPVLAEPIEMICKDDEGMKHTLIIDIERNKATFNRWTTEIYHKGEDNIIWFLVDVYNRSDRTLSPSLAWTVVFYRETGVLTVARLMFGLVEKVDLFTYQCFRSF